MKLYLLHSFIFLSLFSYAQNLTGTLYPKFGEIVKDGYLSQENISRIDKLELLSLPNDTNSYEIVGFSMEHKSGRLHGHERSNSNLLSIKQKEILSKLKVSDKVSFVNILAENQDSTWNIDKRLTFIVDGPAATLFEAPEKVEYKYLIDNDTSNIEDNVRVVGTGPLAKFDKITIERFMMNDHLLVRSSIDPDVYKPRGFYRNYKIISYDLIINVNGERNNFHSNSDKITNEMKKAISHLEYGDRVWFGNIKALHEQEIVEVGNLILLII